MTDDRELKPCPFCKGKSRWNGAGFMECIECGATAPSLKAWNRRPADGEGEKCGECGKPIHTVARKYSRNGELYCERCVIGIDAPPRTDEGEKICDCGELLIRHDFSRPCTPTQVIVKLKEKLEEKKTELDWWHGLMKKYHNNDTCPSLRAYVGNLQSKLAEKEKEYKNTLDLVKRWGLKLAKKEKRIEELEEGREAVKEIFGENSKSLIEIEAKLTTAKAVVDAALKNIQDRCRGDAITSTWLCPCSDILCPVKQAHDAKEKK